MSDLMHEKVFPVIRCGLEISGSVPELSDEEYKFLYDFGDKQDIQLIVWQGLNRAGKNDGYQRLFKNKQYQFMRRFMLYSQAFEEIKSALNESAVDYIPLKGSVLKELYPNSWMRSSCDIDILVHEEDIEKAVSVLTDGMGLKFIERNYHDVLLSDNTVNVELHFSIKEDMNSIDTLLERAWDNAVKIDGYMYGFTPEYFMFHIVSHMAYHMVHGGLGVRPFIDLWLLHQKHKYDEAEFRKMCDTCGISDFYESCCLLTDHWFNGKSLPDGLKDFEDYCLSGGVFGTSATAMAAKQRESSGARYLLQRIIVKREFLQEEFPSLKEKPYLLGYYQVRRWGRLFSNKKWKCALSEMKQVAKTNNEDIRSFDRLLKSVGL